MRAMTSDAIAAITSPMVRPALLVQATFASETIYFWSGLGTIVWNGQAWIGIGSLGSISTIEEGSTVEAKGINFSISGFDPSALGAVMGEFQVALPALVFLGFFDAAGALIDDPVCCFSGRMDKPTLDVSGTSATITINCENRLVEMNVSAERRYTHEDQQVDFPGDLGFQFVNSIQDSQIYFGRFPSTKNNL